jgi:hypothetical protein
LLRLSEAVCERADLGRYSVGGPAPRPKIQPAFCSKANRTLLFFDFNQLANLGVTKEDLDAFVFDDQLLSHVHSEAITSSPLQRFPILDAGDRLVLVLPSAISFAIRAAVIDFVIAFRYDTAFRKALAEDYSELFHNARLLGSFDALPIQFSDNGDLPIAEFLATADSGRYLHVVFYTDTLEHFDESGVGGVDPGAAKHIGLLENRTRRAIDFATQQPGYVAGITLLVHCGVGRGVALPIPNTDRDDWDIEGISAADLYTLSSYKQFNALKLWRALDGAKLMTDLGVKILNVNGLLSLIAWIEANDGHLIPHSQTPESFRNNSSYLSIQPDWVLSLRRRVAEQNDVHSIPTVSGEIKIVRRVTGSFFQEDNALPMYTAECYSPDTGQPMVYVSDHRYWWCHVIPSTDRTGDDDRWLMLKTWLPRIIRVIEPLLNSNLDDVVLLKVTFERVPLDGNREPLPSQREIEDACIITVDVHRCTVSIDMGKAFELGLSHATNVSERALVIAICRGFAQLASVTLSPDELTRIESQIVPNDDARQLHVFQARKYLDFARGSLGGDIVTIDDQDIAALRAGVAFRVESRQTGRSSLRSKRQCTELLNALVRGIEEEICSNLQQFDRTSFVEMCMQNHEVSTFERGRWARTAAANLGLHQDREAALAVIADHEMDLLSVLFPSRVLIEFALCECPTTGGRMAGRLELSRLMAKVNAIWEFGGWSDAIHMDAMPPVLTITPLGDLQAETEFNSDVLAPFAQKAVQMRIVSAVDEYEKNFRPPDTRDETSSKTDPRFEEAWSEEFGFAISDVLTFIDAVEDVGVARKHAFFRLSKSELISELSSNLDGDPLERVLSAFTLHPRATWRTIPDECDEQDIQAWRFRRKLSTIRRPILQLDLSDDPALIVAPGAIRESIAHVIHEYYEGSYPRRHYRTTAMRSWCGKRYKERGSAFAVEVAERVRQLGWQAKLERKVTGLLGGKSDPDFGDLRSFGDVDVLAWNEDAGRILAIECKHLQYQKTAGEIVRQLADYRGQMKLDGKPDDLLKHLNRLELLDARKNALCDRLGVDGNMNLEGWVLFKNPVPMLYAWRQIKTGLHVATFDDIEKVLDYS